ncbi:MAG: N-acetyltransferase [Brevundimonas sp.]|jgi:predicted GNAT family acetyltransferase|uniref:N-acetyltransferase n=1 Tax=Brevundimonas albigilva TaxID=1312364 RepID=A0ABY4SNM2_9CAUL|nr:MULTISPECIES: GNAT family N-acetyltransferase [Brevundimonas]PZU55926.1 MAG: N-acetyltransferase [Brevundimonas sp.]UQV19258.1 N-acetyltransferase [Brevundimonas albigilva]URI15839.1 N-acetyltransferase [Brevundimonas albigilva]
MTDPEIRDNPDRHQYELPVDGDLAVVTYNLSPPNLMITETLVPQRLEGRGIASRLARHVVDDARARDLLILPVCPFFSAWFQKHPDQADVVHPTYRGILGL